MERNRTVSPERLQYDRNVIENVPDDESFSILSLMNLPSMQLAELDRPDVYWHARFYLYDPNKNEWHGFTLAFESVSEPPFSAFKPYILKCYDRYL